MNSSQRLRARFVLGGIVAVAGVLAISLYWIQIVRGQSYADKADQQYERPSASLFDRGSIFFSSKDGTRVSAATIARGYVIHMDPTKTIDPEGAYQAITQYLPLDKEEFLRQAAKPGDRYEKLADRVSEDSAISIQELGLPGIGASKQHWRSYPGGSLSAHVLGLIGESADGSIEGRYGLERSYEDVLRRISVGSSINVFAQIFTGLRDSVFGEGERTPGEIITTIEPTVEGYVEGVLAKIQTEWKSDSIGAIIMDPRTGEIISMSALPNFDAQHLSRISDVSVLSNPLVEHVYEMGSIMKPLTMAIGLDSGVITPKSTYNDTGTMTLDDKKISNYDGRARGVVAMQEVLSQSLNVGAATIALKVGSEKFTKYFNDFGFGEKTGIDQPNEASGLLDNLDSALDIEIATAAYGQGVAVTPIAMIRALALLANDGYGVRPHLVKRIEYENGRTEIIPTDKQGPILGKKAVEDTTKMLVEVVDKALQNGGIKIEHYSVAAKTGTAQIADPGNRGYYKDRYLHSFFGYFPAYDPQFIVFLYQIHPKGAQYASETLTKPFAEITKFLITYYNIAPDR
jgi:stage V sporulation protein D (sporulation-specific penicillin-binding protein)